ALRAAGQGALDGLDQLRRAGVRIYLDDWRALPPAAPSVDDLNALPLDGLKLAAEVVAELPAEAAMATARAALAGAATAGFEPVVAKGVETGEQWRILADLGFRLGQGYRIGTPQDATETGALLAD
ncbi:MAG TPA: EAL domain-containing protein, partial [Actinomycetota bacterium]|nr:EAL domain-containing protein [Actinomycetota bacterium]